MPCKRNRAPALGAQHFHTQKACGSNQVLVWGNSATFLKGGMSASKIPFPPPGVLWCPSRTTPSILGTPRSSLGTTPGAVVVVPRVLGWFLGDAKAPQVPIPLEGDGGAWSSSLCWASSRSCCRWSFAFRRSAAACADARPAAPSEARSCRRTSSAPSWLACRSFSRASALARSWQA